MTTEAISAEKRRELEEQDEKHCCLGNHPFSTEAERGYVFWDIKKGHFACFGCATRARVEEWRKTGILTSRVLMDAAVRKYDRQKEDWVASVNAQYDRIHAAVKALEREVWFSGEEPHKDPGRVEPYSEHMPDEFRYRWDSKMPRSERAAMCPKGGLQAFVIGTTWQTFSADVDGVKYLSQTMAGRSAFQIERGDTYVMVVFNEDSPRPQAGTNGMYGTVDQVIGLLAIATAHWKEGRIKLERPTSDESPEPETEEGDDSDDEEG